jgi:hypothetical protein
VSRGGVEFASGSGTGFGFTPDDDGTYEVTVSVDDGDGGVGSAQASISVANVAPVVAITGLPATVTEGDVVALAATVTDPGVTDAAAISWAVARNGVGVASGSGAEFGFTADDDGTYEVVVSVDDGDGGIGSDQASISVANVAPVVVIGELPGSVVEVAPVVVIGGLPGSVVEDETVMLDSQAETLGATVTDSPPPAGSEVPSDSAGNSSGGSPVGLIAALLLAALGLPLIRARRWRLGGSYSPNRSWYGGGGTPQADLPQRDRERAPRA